MPLVADTDLPSFARLRDEGLEVLQPARARTQDIRELHIGFLNMMPDAALQATERQFLRLVGSCNRIAQFYVHPFTIKEIPRDKKTTAHIKKYYRDFDALKKEGLDALIISGANPAQPDITDEPFWTPLTDAANWARDNVCSVMCSCLATHAIVKLFWGVERYPLPQKRWGVFANRVTATHPLVANINTRFDAPHSHLYEVNAEQFQHAGLPVLAAGKDADLHLAVSPDGLRFVFFQGHPEYDAVSLLKEYRREVGRFIHGARDDYPPFPINYFNDAAAQILNAYQTTVTENKKTPPPFPEEKILEHLDNTWTDTGKAMINNWLGLIYQVAHRERGKVFMDGVDPDDPLRLSARA